MNRDREIDGLSRSHKNKYAHDFIPVGLDKQLEMPRYRSFQTWCQRAENSWDLDLLPLFLRDNKDVAELLTLYINSSSQHASPWSRSSIGNNLTKPPVAALEFSVHRNRANHMLHHTFYPVCWSRLTFLINLICRLVFLRLHDFIHCSSFSCTAPARSSKWSFCLQ